MQAKKRLARNTLYNGVTSTANMAVYFFLMPLIISHLGVTRFGIYVLASSLVSYFGLLELGASAALVKYVAEHHAQNDVKQVREVISATFFFYLGLGAFSALVIAAVGWFFLGYFNIPETLLASARAVMYVLAATAFFSWPLSTFRNALAGLQRYDTIATTGLTVAVLAGLASVAVLVSGLGLVELVIVESLMSIAGLTALTVRLVGTLGYWPVSFKYARPSVFRGLAGFSLGVFIVQLARQLSYRSDTIVLGLFMPIGAIAFYEAANKLQRLCERVFNISNSAVIPAASALDAANDKPALKKLYLRGSAFAAAATFSVAIPMIFLAPWLILYWLGPEFVKVSSAAQVFVSFWFFVGLAGLTRTVLIGIGRVKFLASLVAAKSILNLVISLLLVQEYQIMGVILGTVISEIVFFPVTVAYVLKALEISWLEYFDQVVLKVAKAVGPVALVLPLVLQLRAPVSLLGVGAYGLGAVLTYAAAYYFMSLGPLEKTDLKVFAKLDVLSLNGRKNA